jgi:hypothetical protein
VSSPSYQGVSLSMSHSSSWKASGCPFPCCARIMRSVSRQDPATGHEPN